MTGSECPSNCDCGTSCTPGCASVLMSAAEHDDVVFDSTLDDYLATRGWTLKESPTPREVTSDGVRYRLGDQVMHCADEPGAAPGVICRLYEASGAWWATVAWPHEQSGFSNDHPVGELWPEPE